MNLSRAFNSIFNQTDWLNNIAVTALITLFAALTTPILIGFAGWAALLGYQVEVARRTRADHPQPLPRWGDISRMINEGLPPLIAFVAYNLPTFLLGGCAGFITSISGDAALVGGSMTVVSTCCLLPILLLYNVIALPMFALGMGRYLTDPRIAVFFEFADLFNTLQTHFSIAAQFVLYQLVVLLGFTVLAFIPCVGWIVAAALYIPVQGILTGQFAHTILGKVKPKRA